jgi:predicted GNAT family acetyltransferase
VGAQNPVMTGPLTVERDTELAGYAERVLPWLAADPVLHALPASLIDIRLSGLVPTEPDAWWLRVNAAGRLAGVALRTPPRGLLVTAMPAAAATALAEYCAAADLRPPEAGGPEPASDTFTDRYTQLTGAHRSLAMAQRLYRLDTVTPPAGVPGALREAVATDEALLIEWTHRLQSDVFGSNAPDVIESLRQRLRTGGLLYVWQLGDRPVAMNWISPPVSGVVRVSGVYTPPDLRGHGYASALVAATSQHALDTGATACCLYTDLANPTSNRIYQRIGYRPAADMNSWLLA